MKVAKVDFSLQDFMDAYTTPGFDQNKKLY